MTPAGLMRVKNWGDSKKVGLMEMVLSWANKNKVKPMVVKMEPKAEPGAVKPDPGYVGLARRKTLLPARRLLQRVCGRMAVLLQHVARNSASPHHHHCTVSCAPTRQWQLTQAHWVRDLARLARVRVLADQPQPMRAPPPRVRRAPQPPGQMGGFVKVEPAGAPTATGAVKRKREEEPEDAAGVKREPNLA